MSDRLLSKGSPMGRLIPGKVLYLEVKKPDIGEAPGAQGPWDLEAAFARIYPGITSERKLRFKYFHFAESYFPSPLQFPWFIFS